MPVGGVKGNGQEAVESIDLYIGKAALVGSCAHGVNHAFQIDGLIRKHGRINWLE